MKADFQASGDGALLYTKAGLSTAPKAQLHPSARIEARIGQGMSALLFLENDWRSLAATAGHSRFFQSFEWQLAYLKHMEPRPEATRYVSFFANGRAIAIFPLRRNRRSVGRISLWLWELPSHSHLILGEPLIAPEWASADLIRCLINTLDSDPALPWDALHLPALLDDSVAIRLLRETALPRTHLEQHGQSMFFHCSDMATALANCSGPFKRNLRRQGKKLSQHGTVTLSLARQGAELDAAFAEFLRLESSGWKGENGKASAINLHPHLRGFYGELKDHFAANDACLISLLKLNGEAIAAQFCLQAGTTLSIQKIAYDETWRAEAPGNQLLYQLLEYCCREPGIKQLSLVSSPAWAIGRWNPASQPVWESYVFKASLRGLGSLLMRRGKTRLAGPAQALWQRLQALRQAAVRPGEGSKNESEQQP